MGASNYGRTELAALIDEAWSPEVLTAVEFSTVTPNLFKDYTSFLAHGDILHLPEAHNIGHVAKAEDVALTAQVAGTEPDQLFTLDGGGTNGFHDAVPFLVEDIAEIQSRYNVREVFTQRAAYILARRMEINACALFDDNATQSVGTIATELTDANLRRAWQFLADSNAPFPRYMVISPAAYAGILNLDKFVARTYVGEDSEKAVHQAQVGDIYGASVHVSQQTVGVAPNSDGAMFADGHFIKIIQRPATVHTEYQALQVGWVVVVDALYGFYEIQEPDEAPNVVTDNFLYGVRLRTLK